MASSQLIKDPGQTEVCQPGKISISGLTRQTILLKAWQKFGLNYCGKNKKFVRAGFMILEDIPDKPAFFINIKKEAGGMKVYIWHIISPWFQVGSRNTF